MIIAANVWREPFKIHSCEIDVHGCASIQTLCKCLQEAAGNHVREMAASAKQLMSQGQMWVLSRLHVQVWTYPLWYEPIQVETWAASRLAGIRAYRDFLLLDGNDKLIGAATSLWLLLDVSTRRPTRIPASIVDSRVCERQIPLPNPIEKLEQPERVDFEKRFQVCLHNLDFNQHVNNISYIEWAIGTVPQSVWQNHGIADMQISFLAEGLYGDRVVSQSEHIEKEAQHTFRHRLFCDTSNRELVLAKTVWSDQVFNLHHQ